MVLFLEFLRRLLNFRLPVGDLLGQTLYFHLVLLDRVGRLLVFYQEDLELVLLRLCRLLVFFVLFQ